MNNYEEIIRNLEKPKEDIVEWFENNYPTSSMSSVNAIEDFIVELIGINQQLNKTIADITHKNAEKFIEEQNKHYLTWEEVKEKMNVNVKLDTSIYDFYYCEEEDSIQIALKDKCTILGVFYNSVTFNSLHLTEVEDE